MLAELFRYFSKELVLPVVLFLLLLTFGVISVIEFSILFLVSKLF